MLKVVTGVDGVSDEVEVKKIVKSNFWWLWWKRHRRTRIIIYCSTKLSVISFVRKMSSIYSGSYANASSNTEFF